MRWRGRRKSNNVEDRRDIRASGFRSSGGGMLNLLPMAFKLLGVKGTLVLLVCIGAYSFFSGNLSGLFSIL